MLHSTEIGSFRVHHSLFCYISRCFRPQPCHMTPAKARKASGSYRPTYSRTLPQNATANSTAPNYRTPSVILPHTYRKFSLTSSTPTAQRSRTMSAVALTHGSFSLFVRLFYHTSLVLSILYSVASQNDSFGLPTPIRSECIFIFYFHPVPSTNSRLTTAQKCIILKW